MQLKVISVKEHTSLLVLLPSFLRCNDSWLLLDSGLMADPCNYTSGIDMGARMFGGEHRGRTLGFALTLPRT